jgi:hypothetical protein
LQGYRGKPGVNIDRRIEVLMRFCTSWPTTRDRELDINRSGHARRRVLTLGWSLIVSW